MKTFFSVLLVFLMVSLLPDVNQAATFVVNVIQSSYEAVQNHSITLEWTFTTRTQGSYRELFIICELSSPVKTRKLYAYRDGVEFPESQDDQFSGRVHSDKDVLREGRIRLNVSRLRTEDSGLYTCEVKTEDGFGSAECRLDVSENYHLASPDEPIKARVGSNVVLPCRVKPPDDVRDTSVKWMFNSNVNVHLFRSGGDDPKNQDERYKGRTYLNHTMLKHGNISLTLANVTKDDAGNYTCNVRQLPGHKLEDRNVNLVVVDGNEDPDRSSGGRKIGLGVGIPVIIIIIIIIAGLCYWQRKRKQNGNGNPGDKAEEIPFRVVGQPNQRVNESSPLS